MSNGGDDDASASIPKGTEGRIELADEAPEVNLEALVLENHGLEIVENHPTMGRVIVATRDLDEKSALLFQPILRELPALVCQQQDYLEFMEQFLEAPVELQVGILDMFYQPLDSEMGKSLLEPAKALFMLGAIEDFTVIHQLLSIYMTNGHNYRGTHTAIPLFGSKFAHSCVPNVGYSSLTSEDGALEYKLLRPIKKGELVCFSYLADLLETPTNERRQLLQETKSFRCLCVRCNGPDLCRCLPCPHCEARISCMYLSQSDDPYWECPACGMLESDALLSTEREFGKRLEILNRKIENRKDFNAKDGEVTPELLRELVDECETKLSQTHHLTIKGLRLLLTQTTANAFITIKTLISRGLPVGGPRVFSLFRESVIAGFQLVLAGECIAASCTGCQITGSARESSGRGLELSPKHEPNYDRALAFRHISENLLKLPIYWWPPAGLRMSLRYLPLLRARFGAIITVIEQRVLQLYRTVLCYECGTYWDSIHGMTEPPLSQASLPDSPPSKESHSSDIPVSEPKITAPGSNRKGSTKKKSNKKKKRRK